MFYDGYLGRWAKALRLQQREMERDLDRRITALERRSSIDRSQAHLSRLAKRRLTWPAEHEQLRRQLDPCYRQSAEILDELDRLIVRDPGCSVVRLMGEMVKIATDHRQLGALLTECETDSVLEYMNQLHRHYPTLWAAELVSLGRLEAKTRSIRRIGPVGDYSAKKGVGRETRSS